MRCDLDCYLCYINIYDQFDHISTVFLLFSELFFVSIIVYYSFFFFLFFFFINELKTLN